MKRFSIIFILLVNVLLLAGCASNPVTMNQAEGLERGYTMTQVHDILNNKNPKRVIKTRYQGHNYRAEFYPMETEALDIDVPIIIPGYFYAILPMGEWKGVSNSYIYLFKQDPNKIYRLFSWGFIPNLNKSDVKVVRHVMAQIEKQANI